MPIEADKRLKRQNAIRDILRGRPVERQAELVELLRQRGINATQSSVSRDLRQLGIAKLGDGYTEPADDTASAAAETSLDLPAEFVREVATAGANLTVIKTAIGAAQRVAVYLDRARWREIVGTLSGDDTIFVATKNATDQKRLVNRLTQQIGAQH